MTPETLLRCTESYYSTRRQSAIFEGMSSGMGLGLSFVKTVLQRAGAELSIDSVLNQGTSVSIRFSSAEASKSENV
jgi:signal transduction histidine kinase